MNSSSTSSDDGEFQEVCEEMKEKATACDVSRAANYLHMRAVELIKSQEKHNSLQLSDVSISFRAAEYTEKDVKKLCSRIDGTLITLVILHCHA